MDLHLARVQQRWRYADDELTAGLTLSVDALAHNMAFLPDSFDGTAAETAANMLNFFTEAEPGLGGTNSITDESGTGGSIEPVADDEGVLLTNEHGELATEEEVTAPTLDLAALEAESYALQGHSPTQPQTHALS
jgi:type IV secretion system protein VirD4